MPSVFQNDFSGGEVSPEQSGNFDDPLYSKSLSLCRNFLPTPEKSLVRRGGTRILGWRIPTDAPLVGAMSAGWDNTGCALRGTVTGGGVPVILEYDALIGANNTTITGGLFLWAPPGQVGGAFPAALTAYREPFRNPLAPVCDQYINVTSISDDANPIFHLGSTPSPTFQDGDLITFYVVANDPRSCSILRARTFIYVVVDSTHFTVVPCSSNGLAPATLAPPSTPTLTPETTAGSLNGTTAYVKITYVNHFGETKPSSEASQAISGGNNSCQVTSPAAAGTGGTAATGYNIYSANTTGMEKLNTGGPIAIGVNYLITTYGAGANPPGTNTSSNIVNRTTYDQLVCGHHLQFRNPDWGSYTQFGYSTADTSWIPYESVLDMQIVPAGQSRVFVLLPQIPPWLLDLTNVATPTFKDAGWSWWDGPYEDPIVGGSQTGFTALTIASIALGPPIEVVLKYQTGAVQVPGFRSLGQTMRLWTQPPAWNSASTYTGGDNVTYNGSFWSCGASGGTTTVAPGSLDTNLNIYPWVPVPQLGYWVNGVVVATASSPDTITVQITSNQGLTTYTNSDASTNIIETFRVGVFFLNFSASGNATSVYQQTTWGGRGALCGAWHQGRVWFSGYNPDFVLSYPANAQYAQQFLNNRFDACMAQQMAYQGGTLAGMLGSVPSNFLPVWSPTDTFGNLLDTNAISYTINSETIEGIRWMLPDGQGLLFGTNGSEWLITASALNDPITPVSVQAMRQSQIGASRCPPVLSGLSVLFVQTAKQDLVEYVSDVLSQRFTPRVLNERALHLTGGTGMFNDIGLNNGTYSWLEPGIQSFAYQRQPFPVIWTIQYDGSLASCTYRRLSRFGQEPPVIYAWASHAIATPPQTGTLARARWSQSIAMAKPFDPADNVICGLIGEQG